MGLKNMRAICPNCGGKIHTQAKGLLGSIALGANGTLVKTGTRCQHCGAKLTGKVTATNYAVLDTRTDHAPAPANETREEYLQRINSQHG
jgi:DNA-directed RNA polymerase subunit RPC12/RpoP